MKPSESDGLLLHAIINFTNTYQSKHLESFRQGLENWGDTWQAVEAVMLSAAKNLADTLKLANNQSAPLLSAFIQHSENIHWERTYKSSDTAVDKKLIENYCFAELVGLLGPFVSDRIRAGIGIWAPGVHYPSHQHLAEELYIVLAGSAEYTVGNIQPTIYSTGQQVHVPSNTPHGFRTDTEPLVVLYFWQSGDLRQKSTFL